MSNSNKPNIEFNYLHNPEPNQLGETPLQFLKQLAGPTHIFIPGKDQRRCRAVVTLLHGNEPSGAIAMHQLLGRGLTPAVNMHFFIANVEAALAESGFMHRMLPCTRDLNRCFGEHLQESASIDDSNGSLAKTLLNELREINPEAVIDIHNTSGSGPAFAVTTFMDQRHDALASLFTHRLIVTHLKLGALMEASETLFPTLTVECGGAQEQTSHLLAEDGLRRFCEFDDVLSEYRADIPMQYFHNPIRLELTADIPVYYGNYLLDHEGITLRNDIERYNFGVVETGATLGYLQAPLLQHLTAKDLDGCERVHDYFHVVGNELHPTQPLHMFMVTGNPGIAKSDCMFYFIPVPV